MGIDWGMGTCNIDRKTGIRYGVISANEVGDAWYEVEGDYGDPACPRCGGKVVESDDDSIPCDEETGVPDWVNGDYVCVRCERAFYGEQVYADEPIGGFNLNDGTYKAHQGHDDSDIFILKSPYYTYCEFCSPCAPGAGYLMSAGPVKAYCLGHDFYWGHHEHPDRAPYRVFRVEDDVELLAIRVAQPCETCRGSGRRTIEEVANVRKEALTSQFISDAKRDWRMENFSESDLSFDCYACRGKGYVQVWNIQEAIDGEEEETDDEETGSEDQP